MAFGFSNNEKSNRINFSLHGSLPYMNEIELSAQGTKALIIPYEIFSQFESLVIQTIQKSLGVETLRRIRPCGFGSPGYFNDRLVGQFVGQAFPARGGSLNREENQDQTERIPAEESFFRLSHLARLLYGALLTLSFSYPVVAGMIEVLINLYLVAIALWVLMRSLTFLYALRGVRFPPSFPLRVSARLLRLWSLQRGSFSFYRFS